MGGVARGVCWYGRPNPNCSFIAIVSGDLTGFMEVCGGVTSIPESMRRRSKARGFGVPVFDPHQNLKHVAKISPFEEVQNSRIKLKSVPIELSWPSKDDSQVSQLQEQRACEEKVSAGVKQIDLGKKAESPFRQRPWFRLPVSLPDIQRLRHVSGIGGEVSERLTKWARSS